MGNRPKFIMIHEEIFKLEKTVKQMVLNSDMYEYNRKQKIKNLFIKIKRKLKMRVENVQQNRNP